MNNKNVLGFGVSLRTPFGLDGDATENTISYFFLFFFAPPTAGSLSLIKRRGPRLAFSVFDCGGI